MITPLKLQGFIHIIVKPSSSCTEIVSFDEKNKILKVSLKARPKDGKANTELVKFLSKVTKKKVIIKSGLTSKRKVVEIA